MKSFETKELELFQARANPASKKKGFLLVDAGFCQAAKPLKVKQEDLNKASVFWVLQTKAFGHPKQGSPGTWSLCQGNSKGPCSWKGSPLSLPNKTVFQSPCLFTYTICFYKFLYHLAY